MTSTVAGPSRTGSSTYLASTTEGISVTIDGTVPGESWNRTWQRGISDPGSGGLVVPNDDPIMATVDYGSIMRFSLGGIVRQSATVEKIDRVWVDDSEEAGQVATISGRGLVAEWDRALVYPDLGDTTPLATGLPIQLGPPRQDDRYYNWTASTGVDRTGWPNAVMTDPRYGHRDSPAQRFVRPDGWPDSTSEWIWDRSSTASVPVGDVYFGHAFEVHTTGRYQVWVAADDNYELWLDGIKILSRDGAYAGAAEHIEIDMDAGNPFHLLAARATNMYGYAGLQVSVLPVSTTGALGTYTTHTVGGVGNGWHVIGYPARPPGQTVGRAIRLEYLGAQRRGMLLDWALGFSETVDSAGQPWPYRSDLTCPVGISMLDMLNRWSQDQIDYSFSPGAKILRAWNIGTMGTAATWTDAITLSVDGEG